MKIATTHTQSIVASAIGGIEARRPDELHPWPGNPRSHSTKQLARLKTSILSFGFTNAMLVDEVGIIFSSHGPAEAAICRNHSRVSPYVPLPVDSFSS